MRTRMLTTVIAGMFLGAVTRLCGQAPTDTMTITPGLIALGDSIFHGKVAGGLCFGCHGVDGKGTPGLAPDLTSGKWLHGDGSYASIMKTVEAGVPHPKTAPAPMPPMGGAKLSPAELRAVAAYVFALSHPKAAAGH
ncbi:MAG TPA: c-type cytochrome [Gemmatimonadales bacterium]|nr:c-type cytochrome [Gemmatimonadales bacterium]